LDVKGTKTAPNWPEFPGDRELGALDTFFLSHELKRLSARIDPLSPTSPPFDRDEVLVCMALAFCLAGASTGIVYRLLG